MLAPMSPTPPAQAINDDIEKASAGAARAALRSRTRGGLSTRHSVPGGAGARQALQRDHRSDHRRARPHPGAARRSPGRSSRSTAIATRRCSTRAVEGREPLRRRWRERHRPARHHRAVEPAAGRLRTDARLVAGGRSVLRSRPRRGDPGAVLGQLPADLRAAPRRARGAGRGLPRRSLRSARDPRGARRAAGRRAGARAPQSARQPGGLLADRARVGSTGRSARRRRFPPPVAGRLRRRLRRAGLRGRRAARVVVLAADRRGGLLVPVKIDGCTKELVFFGGRVAFLTFPFEPDAAVTRALESKTKCMLRATIGSPAALTQEVALAALAERRRRGRDRRGALGARATLPRAAARSRRGLARPHAGAARSTPAASR